MRFIEVERGTEKYSLAKQYIRWIVVKFVSSYAFVVSLALAVAAMIWLDEISMPGCILAVVCPALLVLVNRYAVDRTDVLRGMIGEFMEESEGEPVQGDEPMRTYSTDVREKE